MLRFCMTLWDADPLYLSRQFVQPLLLPQKKTINLFFLSNEFFLNQFKYNLILFNKEYFTYTVLPSSNHWITIRKNFSKLPIKPFSFHLNKFSFSLKQFFVNQFFLFKFSELNQKFSFFILPESNSELCKLYFKINRLQFSLYDNNQLVSRFMYNKLPSSSLSIIRGFKTKLLIYSQKYLIYGHTMKTFTSNYLQKNKHYTCIYRFSSRTGLLSFKNFSTLQSSLCTEIKLCSA